MFEQVHHGRASELKRFGAYRFFKECGPFGELKLIQKYDNLHAIRERTADDSVNLSQIKEKKFLPETKILLQQPIALKTGLCIRQNRFIAAEADVLKAFRSERNGEPFSTFL